MMNRKSWSVRAVVVAVLVLGAAVLGVGVGTAQANPAVPDLPVSVKVCKVDTGPNSPSCQPVLRVVAGSPEPTAIILNFGWACTGGVNEPIHCKPIIVWCTDDYQLCGTVPPVNRG